MYEINLHAASGQILIILFLTERDEGLQEYNVYAVCGIRDFVIFLMRVDKLYRYIKNTIRNYCELRWMLFI